MSERLRRALWASLSPFVWAANRVGLCSYKWVNVCLGARRPDLFNPLWHYRFYGTPIRALPDRVNLCGIGYRAAASEGTVTFVNTVWRNRITFDRDAIENEALWHVTLPPNKRVTAGHVSEAYAWVRAVYGDSFEYRTPEPTP